MRYVRIGTLYEPGLQELAVEFLKCQVHDATWKQMPESTRHQAMAFIQGSGLETILEVFDLPVDPAHFRNVFIQCVSQKSAWLSATTLGILS